MNGNNSEHAQFYLHRQNIVTEYSLQYYLSSEITIPFHKTSTNIAFAFLALRSQYITKASPMLCFIALIEGAFKS